MKTMKAKVKILVWDMDGTIADLYGVENWLPMLRAFDPTPIKWRSPCGIWRNWQGLSNWLRRRELKIE